MTLEVNYYIAYKLAALKLQSGLADEAMQLLGGYENVRIPPFMRKVFSKIQRRSEIPEDVFSR